MKKLIAVVLTLVIVMTLVACGNSSAPTEPAAPAGSSGGSSAAAPVEPEKPAEFNPVDIRMNIDNNSISGFDVHLDQSSNLIFWHNIYGSLMSITADHGVEPDLAESYELSDDGKVYTFKLRQGVQWHRGFGEFTADDIVFSLERGRDHESSLYKGEFSNIEKVEALDPYTVQITLKEIYPDFLYLVGGEYAGGLIISKKAMEELGEEGYEKTPVGTGPFWFAEDKWISQQESTYMAFEDYYKDPPGVNVTITEIKDGNTALLAYQNGELDIILSSQLEILTGAEAAGATLFTAPSVALYGIYLDGNVYAPFKDQKVRQAIYHAIDREGNRLAVFGEFMARANNGPVPDILPGYSEEGLPVYDYDPEKSKALLKEAGYENKLSFTATVQNNARNERIWTLIQSQLKDVGIAMEVNLVSSTDYYEASAAHELAMSYNSMASVPTMSFFLSQNFLSTAPRNCAAYTAGDDLIKAYQSTPDGPEREALIKEIQLQLATDMPYFPHHGVNVPAAYNPKVQGLYSKGASGGDVRLEKLWVQE